MAVERFKLEDGREGSMAEISPGLTKMLFDDGDCIIVATTTAEEENEEDEDEPGS